MITGGSAQFGWNPVRLFILRLVGVLTSSQSLSTASHCFKPCHLAVSCDFGRWSGLMKFYVNQVIVWDKIWQNVTDKLKCHFEFNIRASHVAFQRGIMSLYRADFLKMNCICGRTLTALSLLSYTSDKQIIGQVHMFCTLTAFSSRWGQRCCKGCV